MSRFKIAAVGALTLGLLAGGAVAASAGVTPSPTPTQPVVTPTPPVPTPQTCTPRPITFAPTVSPTDTPTDQVGLTAWHGATPPPVVNPQRRCAPETFVAQVTALGSHRGAEPRHRHRPGLRHRVA